MANEVTSYIAQKDLRLNLIHLISKPIHTINEIEQVRLLAETFCNTAVTCSNEWDQVGGYQTDEIK